MLKKKNKYYILVHEHRTSFKLIKTIANWFYDDYVRINGLYYHLSGLEFFNKDKSGNMIKIRAKNEELVKQISKELNGKEWEQ